MQGLGVQKAIKAIMSKVDSSNIPQHVALIMDGPTHKNLIFR